MRKRLREGVMFLQEFFPGAAEVFGGRGFPASSAACQNARSASPYPCLGVGEDDGQRHFAVAEIVADGFAEIGFVRLIIECVVDNLERHAQRLAVSA